MAGASSRGLYVVIMAVVFAAALSLAQGREHLVGGNEDAWKVPASEDDSLNKWAQKSRFQIGDYLVWKYDSKKDSVLEVTRDAYLTCNTTAPLAAHTDGATRVLLHRPGPYFFISGVKSNCDKGEKLIVVAMTPRDRSSSMSPAVAPAPAVETEAPAAAPTSGAAGFKGGLVVGLGVLAGILMM